MEKSADDFEITINEGADTRLLVIRPEDTTDGVPVYHCYPVNASASIGQVRQEPTGEWVQIWGDLPHDTVKQIGAAIARRMA